MTVEISDGISFTTAILCEDVRPEAANKWTLLGVFPGGLMVPNLPANLRIGMYIEATLAKDYKGPIHLRMLNNGTEVAQMRGELDAKVGFVALPIAAFVAGFAHEGTIEIEVGTDAVHWRHLLTRDLLIGPPPAT
jgi:hypothetical protein